MVEAGARHGPCSASAQIPPRLESILRILLVDDEPTIRLSLGDTLEGAGHTVTVAGDGIAAVERLKDARYELVVSDIRMPRMDGLQLFEQTRALAPQTDVILMTAYGEVRDAVAALRDGACDYLIKPFADDELLVRVQRVQERRSLNDEIQAARRVLAEDRGAAIDTIIGRSPPVMQLKGLIDAIAPSDAAVMVRGESGTGKELIARSLHMLSDRADGPFVPVHCAAFPETLLAAELFGHERGAFTGAIRQRDGRFKTAHGGTLFLDEIAEIPLPAQAKLLRVLQEGEFTPIGSDKAVQVDVRIVSATHRDLKARIAEGLFREDLYYRLNVLDIIAPPLRERASDLPLLVEHFLALHSKGEPPTMSPEAWAALLNHPFPGNVRELGHAIHHAVVLSRGKPIQVAHLPRDISKEAYGTASDAEAFKPLSEANSAFERTYLLRALRLCDGARAQAAGVLGISRKNLWEKMKAHGIDDALIAASPLG